MALDLYRIDPTGCEFFAGGWGYFADVKDEPDRFSIHYDHSGAFHHTNLVQVGYRRVRHYAIPLDWSLCGTWAVPDHREFSHEIYFRAYERDSIPTFTRERKLTREEFTMLAFLNFPEMTEEELDHLVWAADEYEIPLVPEKRDYLLIAAKLSQD